MAARPVPLPRNAAEWESALIFAEVEDKRKAGLVNIAGGNCFELVGYDEPVEISGVSLPYGCTSVEDLKAKHNGQLRLYTGITKLIWDSLAGLDQCFAAWGVRNARKLFETDIAREISENPALISMKMGKRYAPKTGSGLPDLSAKINFVVMWRSDEVDELTLAQGKEGTYVKAVSFKPLDVVATPLADNATRFLLVKGRDAAQRPQVAAMLRIDPPLPGPGAPKMRPVGPCDFKGGVAHKLYFNIKNWAMAPGGGLYLSFRVLSAVVENVERIAPLPEGFVMLDDTGDIEPSPAPHQVGRSDGARPTPKPFRPLTGAARTEHEEEAAEARRRYAALGAAVAAEAADIDKTRAELSTATADRVFREYGMAQRDAASNVRSALSAAEIDKTRAELGTAIVNQMRAECVAREMGMAPPGERDAASNVRSALIEEAPKRRRITPSATSAFSAFSRTEARPDCDTLDYVAAPGAGDAPDEQVTQH